MLLVLAKMERALNASLNACCNDEVLIFWSGTDIPFSTKKSAQSMPLLALVS